MAGTTNRAGVLSGTQIAELRERLESERSRLREKIADISGAHGNLGAKDPVLNDPEDFAEMAQDITYEETQLALSVNDLRLLSQIERALQRMDEGAYGRSEITGAPIPYERLEALPWATTNVQDGVRK
jgi:DnaK suppressor protein